MNDKTELYRSLMESAARAREFSYSPYSHYCVGAALLTADGRIYTGCNVENAGLSATNCAERTAIFKAISEGERQFSAIAVVGGKRQDPPAFCAPCGICRQVMAEFCDSDFRILLGNSDKLEAYTLAAILPLSFGRDDLQ